ncbi:hypothetical protein Peur_025233 [Populus x canadensis]
MTAAFFTSQSSKVRSHISKHNHSILLKKSGTINKNLENRIPNKTIPAQLANISMH